MARIPSDAKASAIEACVQNAQNAIDYKGTFDRHEAIVNLGDAIIALTNQVKLLNDAIRDLDDRHVSIPLKTRSQIRIWME